MLVTKRQGVRGLDDKEKLDPGGRGRGLVEGRGSGEPELAGGWALSGLGQNKVLEPTRKWGVQQVGTEDRAGITGWGWCLEPGRNLAGGVVREKREGFMTSLGQEHLLRTGSQEVLHSTSTPGVATVENRTEILKKKKKNTAIGMTQKFSSWVYI